LKYFLDNLGIALGIALGRASPGPEATLMVPAAKAHAVAGTAERQLRGGLAGPDPLSWTKHNAL